MVPPRLTNRRTLPPPEQLRSQIDPRTAFTMVELLLVLSVLAIIVALAVPNTLRLIRQQMLLDSSEKVRLLVSSARVHAIESGLVYQFRYEPGGQHFVVVPFEHETEGISPNSQNTGTAAGLGRFSRASGTLPTNIRFMASTSTGQPATPTSTLPMTGMGQQISADALNGLPDAGKLASLQWSGPILFQPNGSAMDTMVDVVDKHNQHVTLKIRGITGGVSLSRLHQPERK